MNKDALLATLIGFFIGLLITGLLLAGPNLAKMLPNLKLPTINWPKAQQKTTLTPTPTPADFAVTIDSPLADSIEAKDEILVSGTTSPEAMVVVSGQIDDAVVKVKNDGKYAGKVSLNEGKNEITVTSYLKDKQISQTVTIFYTPEDF